MFRVILVTLYCRSVPIIAGPAPSSRRTNGPRRPAPRRLRLAQPLLPDWSTRPMSDGDVFIAGFYDADLGRMILI